MPPPGLVAGATAPSSSSSGSGADGSSTGAATNENGEPMQEPDPADGQLMLEPAVKDLEEAVTAYLRRATETFDLSKNVEVCTVQYNVQLSI